VTADDWGRIGVVRCGVDGLFLSEPATPVPDVQTLVSVARLSEQKGQFVLVEAARVLRDRLRAEGRSFRLVLVGDGELRPQVEAYLAEHQLADVVHITGWQSGAEVKRNIQAGRAMILPSFAEGLPVVIMEALALGRPVLSTYIAGIPELVVPGECGWLVPAGAIEPLVAAMREILDTPVERLSAMGLAGRARVEAQHDVNATARSLLEQIEAR
jgi:glycosyltransferase involved in cell wall biosynthesis